MTALSVLPGSLRKGGAEVRKPGTGRAEPRGGMNLETASFFEGRVARRGRGDKYRLAMVAHLFPTSAWLWRMIRSSSSVQGRVVIFGSRLATQRARHCLPVLGRPGKAPFTSRATSAQAFFP